MSPRFRPHVLVVDDDLGIQAALTAALGGLFVVHGAATGAEALAQLQVHPIAAIVLDAFLGEERGLELVEQFRALSAAAILLFTAYGSEDLAAQALWARVDGYLKKPLDMHQLLAAVRQIVPGADPEATLAARARRYLDEHFGKPIQITDIAGQLGVSERHLRRLFRDAYGRTVQRYLTEIRLRHAAHLLRTTPWGPKRSPKLSAFAPTPGSGGYFVLCMA